MDKSDAVSRLVGSTENLLTALGKQSSLGYKQVWSWEGVVAEKAVERWRSAELDAANAIGGGVQERSMDRYQEWNEVVTRLRPGVVALVDSDVISQRVPEQYRKVVRTTLRWDLLHALVEQEYADLGVPDFFRTLT